MRTFNGALTAAAVALWAVAIAGILVCLPDRVMGTDLAAAVAATVVAAVRRAHDDDRRLLLRLVADLTRPRSPRATGPLRQVR